MWLNRLITSRKGRRAESSTESRFAEVLAELVHVERVSVDSNFFDDLGADSMVMAQFCARVRKRPDLPAVSIKDVYQHPTIASLAAALIDTAPVPLERVLADVLADVVRADRVSVDSNFFDDLGADSMVMAQFCARVQEAAGPAVGVDQGHLPTPDDQRAWPRPSRTPRQSPLSGMLADVLADVVRAERVSVDSNFFDDLGADSMVMAQFCARVQEAAGPAVGIDQGHLPTPDDRKPGGGTRGRRACACRVAGSGPGRGGEEGGNMAGLPLRRAATAGLFWIYLSRRTGYGPRL